jgi:hypothetical protein
LDQWMIFLYDDESLVWEDKLVFLFWLIVNLVKIKSFILGTVEKQWKPAKRRMKHAIVTDLLFPF